MESRRNLTWRSVSGIEYPGGADGAGSGDGGQRVRPQLSRYVRCAASGCVATARSFGPSATAPGARRAGTRRASRSAAGARPASPPGHAAGRPGGDRGREPAGMVHRRPRDHDRGRRHGPGLYDQHGRGSPPRARQQRARRASSRRQGASPSGCCRPPSQSPLGARDHRMDRPDGEGERPVPTWAGRRCWPRRRAGADRGPTGRGAGAGRHSPASSTPRAPAACPRR